MLELKRFFERQIGVAPVAPGEDTQWSWRFNLGWPDWVFVIFLVLAVAYVVAIYLREGAATKSVKLSLAAIRIAIVALLLVMLGELELFVERTGLPYLVFAIDDSESQTVRDRPALATATEADEVIPTRYEQVVAWLSKNDGEHLRQLTRRFKLRFYATAGSLRRIGEDVITPEEVPALLEELRKREPNGSESKLGDNLRALVNDLRGVAPAAMVLPTDGVVTSGEPLAQSALAAERKQIGVFTVGVGDPAPPRDLELTDLLVDDTVFVGDDVTFEAKLIAQGLKGSEAVVSLRGEGIVEPVRQTIKITGDNVPHRVRLTFHPDSSRPQKTGTFNFTIDVPTVDREINKENNRLEKPITFIDEKVRILLVDTVPRYESRFLKDLLDRQSTVDVRVLLFDADPEHVQQDRAAIGYFPTNAEDLAKFDVLVLGDVRPNFFSQPQIELIKEFVKKGGGLAVVAGPRYCPQTFRDTALEDLLPVKVGPSQDMPTGNREFQPKLTPEGALSSFLRFDADESANANLWTNLPPLYWFSEVEKAKPAAQVLLEHPTKTADGKPAPLLAVQYYGAGRTVFQGFDGSWRWTTVGDDLYYSRYWTQMMRFLSRTKLLGKNRIAELTVDRVRVRRGEPIQIRVQVLDASKAPRGDEQMTVGIERSGAEGRRIEVPLKKASGRNDVFEGMFTQTRDGEYRVRLSSVSGEAVNQMARFTVLPPPGELDNVRMDEAELQAAAQQASGKYFALASADELFDDDVLPYGRRAPIQNDPPYPLWRTWPTLLLFATLLLVEWLVRKRFRMV